MVKPDENVHVETSGSADAPPVLFLHGGGVGGWMWRPVVEALDGEVLAIVPDLPGHDHSAGLAYHSHHRTATQLPAVIEREARGPVTVVGFSMGAQLAVLLAAERPDLVASVVAVSAQAIPTPAAKVTLGVVGASAGLARYAWFARLQSRALSVPEALVPDYVRTSQKLSRDTLVTTVGENIRFTPPAGWAKFPGRALIMFGSREAEIVKASGRVLHEALPGSEVEMVVGCGHGIPLERPVWFANRLRGSVLA